MSSEIPAHESHLDGPAPPVPLREAAPTEGATASLGATLADLKAARDALGSLIPKLGPSGEILDKLRKAGPILDEFIQKLRAYDREVNQRRESFEATRDESLEGRLDPMMAALRSLDERISEFTARVAEAEAQAGQVADSRRPPLGQRVLAWAGAAMVLVVGVALLFVVGIVYRQATAAGLNRDKAQVDAIVAKLDAAEGRLREITTTANQANRAVTDLTRFGPQHAQTLADAKAALAEINSRRAQLDEAIAALNRNVDATGRLADDLRAKVATAAAEVIRSDVARPIESNKVAIDELAGQLQGLRALQKRPARPERTGIIVFNSVKFKAENCKPALERLLLNTPLRWGFENYQVALFLASNGAVQKDGKILPFGSDPAPLPPFRSPWTTEPGSDDDFSKFDPSAVLSDLPDGVARRLVLVAGPSAAPPRRDDPRWPKAVKVHALIVGKPDPDRLKEWADFCKDRGGEAVNVPSVGDDKFSASLTRMTQPG